MTNIPLQRDPAKSKEIPNPNDENSKKFLSRIKKNVLLKNYTTFKIGGRAEYFFEANNKQELLIAIKWAQEQGIPIFVLGGGSNVLISDKGLRGLVIRTKSKELKVQDDRIFTLSGVELFDLVNIATDNDLCGIEWFFGIPGTIGGAVYGSISAFDSSIKDVVQSVEAIDISELKIKNFQKEDCQFAYKQSIFKKNKNLIILSCVLKLKKENKKIIKEQVDSNLTYRKKSHPLKFPSAGCVFENYPLSGLILKEFPELKQFNKTEMIPAAYLIEKCGLKGKKIGNAQISEIHANFIVNLGKAKAEDVLRLVKIIKQEVKGKFGIVLKQEVQYLNNF